MASRIDIPAGHVIIGARGGFVVPVQSNGLPVDITLWTMEFSIRKGPEPDDEEVVSVTTTADANGGVSVINGPQGAPNAVRIDLSPLATTTPSVLDRGTYYYTIQRLEVGLEYAIAYGNIELDMSAARED